MPPDARRIWTPRITFVKFRSWTHAPTIREWNPESLTRSPKSFPTARRTPTSLLDTESKAELNRQLEEWEREIGVLMQEEGSEPKSLKDTLATYLFTKGSEASRTLQRMGKVG